MIKMHFPFVVTLVLVLGGCAQTPLRNTQTLSAEAAHYGVSPELLRTAGSAGYFPETHGGKTFFCTQQAQTFSYVPRSQCLDTAQMTVRLQQSASGLSDLQHRISTMTSAPTQ